ncbi:sigma-70 family RNA polymerase sigma factor [Streptomyces sp. TRM66268-LWL]|uniref:Sigma-70 family RNA polymerase sigma factor n=1 Tax=Streptomyces polyasparticus TaxID=2767826 RepID=A0ABR7S7A5_9ACTN|nr:sigma-70 family RNA polymerase sigma factor [Streptomyces polyasparticus]MBC9711004.1 sigma-70 family RNA polymerase sigma factor [Streptomyces polyasparticus]
MTEPRPAEPVAQAFEAERGRLHAVAHRMLGSHADAEDVVQEAWLRLARQDPAAIDNLGGWLTTVVGRLSLDALRSRRTRPQPVYDDQLPELVVTLDADPVPAPEETAALADSVGAALLVVLESLGPNERLAFVLHDLFAVPFDEIGRILGRSTAAAKMTASRARRKVQAAERPQPGPEQRAVVRAFLKAARGGDFDELLRVLDPEVRLSVDTAEGEVVVLGATKVAASARFGAGEAALGRTAVVNGRPGLVSWGVDGKVASVLSFSVADGRIIGISVVNDPVRLAELDLPMPE